MYNNALGNKHTKNNGMKKNGLAFKIQWCKKRQAQLKKRSKVQCDSLSGEGGIKI